MADLDAPSTEHGMVAAAATPAPINRRMPLRDVAIVSQTLNFR
jgi:hypothetical protein